ncbi:hypothetical protein CGRA01v4_07405 [Colletotrichum graminicola]|nr:hypothetical protein CGRA01v4_07405 [Colletotrichum graminicola]
MSSFASRSLGQLGPRPIILYGRRLRCGGRRWILLPDSFSSCGTCQLWKGLGLGWKGG